MIELSNWRRVIAYNINYDMLATHDHGVGIAEVLSNAMKGDSLDLKIEENC